MVWLQIGRRGTPHWWCRVVVVGVGVVVRSVVILTSIVLTAVAVVLVVPVPLV